MKHFKRANLYKSSNVTFNPETVEAFSYRWWKFVAVVEGKLVFNNYRYSVTTAKHQRKMRTLLRELNIKIDIELPLPRGIESTSLESLYLTAEEHLCDQVSKDELKRQARNEKAKVRRAEKRAKADAEFKRNIESITWENVIEFRAAKAAGVL